MKKVKIFTAVFSLLLSISTISLAQVTVGSEGAPIDGAILQLKQDNNLSTNSKKGLAFPRVFLTDTEFLYPMFTAGYDASQNAMNEGLTVYNTNPAFGNGRGVYTWQLVDATYLWVSLKTSVSVADKTLAMVLKNADQFIPGRVNDTNPVTADITWSSISGINTSDISIVNGTDIKFPPHKNFKITGFIGVSEGIGGSTIATYIAARFYKVVNGTPDATALPISTWGYSESSTETIHDGGSSLPICIFNTGADGATIRMIANGPTNNRSTYMAKSPDLSKKSMPSLASYLIIEEL